MSLNLKSIPLYREHAGTIRVSGSSTPKDISGCAFATFQKGIQPIDFLVIGANANQQATKGMGIFCFAFNRNQQYRGNGVAFQPLLFKTKVVDMEGQPSMKSATVWRTILFQQNENSTSI